MDPELQSRRKETWKLLIVQGVPYRNVCERLSDKYDVTASAIEKDISRMDNWIGDLIHVDDTSGHSRLMEIRENRQRLQRMAVEARQDGDREEELRIRRMIDKSAKLDVTISQSLGITARSPNEVSIDGAVNHDHDHDHEHGHQVVPFNAEGKNEETGDGLTDKQRSHIEALTGGEEEIPVAAVESESDGETDTSDE